MKFCFSFPFWFWFLLFKSFCILVNSTWARGAIDSQLSLDWPRSAIEFFFKSAWPRDAIDGQLSLIWPRSAIAFSFANFPRGLAMPSMVNSLLIGLEVP